MLGWVVLLALAAQVATPTPAESPGVLASPTAYLSPTPTYFSPGSIVLTATPLPDDSLELLPEVAYARFTPSTYAPRTGQPFTLVLSFDLPPGFTLAEWPELPEQWGGFMLEAAGEVTQRQREDGGTVHEQALTARLWAPGDYTTPEAFVAYSDGRSTLRIPVRSVFINVPTVLIPGDENLRPLRPPVDLPYLPPWLLVIGVVMVGLAFRAGQLIWRRRPVPVVVEDTPPPPSPAVQAAAALTALRRADAASVHAAVSAVLREYIEQRFGVEVSERTTDELIERLRGRMSGRVLAGLHRLLAEADEMKFTAQPADDAGAQQYIEGALRWLTVADREAQPAFAAGDDTYG